MSSLTNYNLVPLSYPSVGDSEADTQRGAARAQGFAAGYAEGAREAERELATLRAELSTAAAAQRQAADTERAEALRALRAATDAASSAVLPIVADAEEAVVHAALTLAEAILGTELTNTEVATAAALRRIMDHESAPLVMKVRMHPTALAHVGGSDLPFIVTADPSVPAGSAVAEIPDGVIDARISTAVDRARAVLTGGA